MQAVVNVVVFGDIFHDEAKKKSRYSEDYRKLSCQILLDKEDMARIGVKDGQNVSLENEFGRIVVAAKSSDDDPHPGMAFMMRSPWSNQLSGDDPCDPISPEFKGIYANVSPSSEILTELSEIFKKIAT